MELWNHVFSSPQSAHDFQLDQWLLPIWGISQKWVNDYMCQSWFMVILKKTCFFIHKSRYTSHWIDDYLGMGQNLFLSYDWGNSHWPAMTWGAMPGCQGLVLITYNHLAQGPGKEQALHQFLEFTGKMRFSAREWRFLTHQWSHLRLAGKSTDFPHPMVVLP